MCSRRIHTSKWKNRSVKCQQDRTEKPKIKFNLRYNLRRKAVHLSINTEKDEGVTVEFKSPERKAGDIRINTELVNWMADEKIRETLKTLVTNM